LLILALATAMAADFAEIDAQVRTQLRIAAPGLGIAVTGAAASQFGFWASEFGPIATEPTFFYAAAPGLGLQLGGNLMAGIALQRAHVLLAERRPRADALFAGHFLTALGGGVMLGGLIAHSINDGSTKWSVAYPGTLMLLGGTLAYSVDYARVKKRVRPMLAPGGVGVNGSF